jgi:tetratricopeptide (TPR) repeat protein
MRKHESIILLATVALGIAVAAFHGRDGPNECLKLADHTAQPAVIRAAARSAEKAGHDLCEGLALLAERKGTPASERLAKAMAGAAQKDRWSIEGHYALALALSNRTEPALRYWQTAIAAGEKAGNFDRANLFRGARAVHFALREQYRDALNDFEAVYRQTSFDQVRGTAAYNAFKVVVLDKNEAEVERWFPLAFAALDKANDAEKLAYATEVYGQLLDERGDFEASAAVYQQGLAATDGWGDEYWHAELLEFAGQSRFAAGDFAGGEQFYRRAADMFRRAGEPEYAAQMDRNLRARRARRQFETDAS